MNFIFEIQTQFNLTLATKNTLFFFCENVYTLSVFKDFQNFFCFKIVFKATFLLFFPLTFSSPFVYSFHLLFNFYVVWKMHFDPKCQLDICYKTLTEIKNATKEVFFHLLPQKHTKVSLFMWMSLSVKHNAKFLCCSTFFEFIFETFFFPILPPKSTEEKRNLKNDFWHRTFCFSFFVFIFKLWSCCRAFRKKSNFDLHKNFAPTICWDVAFSLEENLTQSFFSL